MRERRIIKQKKKKPFVSCLKSGNFQGVLSYNLLYNLDYKKAFEADWKYILSNGDVRMLHAMQLRAQNGREDEDYKLAEVRKTL